MIDLLIPIAAWLALVGLILVCNYARCDRSSSASRADMGSATFPLSGPVGSNREGEA